MERIKIRTHTRNQGRIRVQSYFRNKRPKGKKRIKAKPFITRRIRDEYGRFIDWGGKKMFKEILKLNVLAHYAMITLSIVGLLYVLGYYEMYSSVSLMISLFVTLIVVDVMAEKIFKV